MRILLCLLLAAVAGPLLGTAPLTAQNGAAPAMSALNPGDALRITVWRKPELSGEYIIATDSSIADPFYMDVKVGGRSMADASRLISEYVARYETSPRVLVEPLFRVSVGGEVRQPNLLSLRPETTVVQAIMLAGGPTERGRISRVHLRRNDGLVVIDLTDSRSDLAHTTVRSGDQIVVPRRLSILRDYLAPVGSIVGATASLIHVFLRYR